MAYSNIKSFLDIGSDLKKICAAKDGQVFFLDNEDLLLLSEKDGVYVRRTVGVVTSLSFSEALGAVLCCVDGAVTAVSQDLLSEISFVTPKELDLTLLCSTSNSSGSIICASAELKISFFEKDENEAFLVFWDTRCPSNPIGYYKECHSDSIVSLSFKDDSDFLLMSGGLDGLVVVYDIREGSEDDAVQLILNSNDVVQKCGWLSYLNKIYCTTGSEILKTWTVTDGEATEDNKIKSRERSDNLFLINCIDSLNHEMTVMSVSEENNHLYVDGSTTHIKLSLEKLNINGVDFIQGGAKIVAFSDKNVYIYQ